MRLTPADIEARFHPVLRPVAIRTQELLDPMHVKVHARPGVAEIDAKGEFSEHWTSSLRELCEIVYGDARDRVRSVLEIGAYEGRSTVFLATFFPKARIDTIDTFAGSDEHKFVPAASRTEAVFDRNTAAFKARIKKHKGWSYDHLPRLRAAGSQFDAAFIDGSHFSDDIYVDTFYAWAMLKPGGVLIWDDYLWSEYANPLGDPRAAIDRFLEVHQGEFEPLFAGWLVAVRKAVDVCARSAR
jgi:predicted O-methyltransferase YrrM